MYRLTGTARVFTTERAAIAAIKSTGADRIQAGTVMVLICRGPIGAGMEEVYQVTSALKYLDVGKSVALLTDARFSGVSTGPCIGHIGPEALGGGPIGRVRDGDRIRVVIDRGRLEGSVDLVTVDTRRARRSPPTPRSPRARRGRTSRPTPRCPTTRGSGPRCSTRAEARGRAACTTPMRLLRRWQDRTQGEASPRPPRGTRPTSTMWRRPRSTPTDRCRNQCGVSRSSVETLNFL